MTAEEFVRGIMERLEVHTAAELAEEMGWKRGAERTVSRWLAGGNQPSFGYVMEMVERAGLLNAKAGGSVRLTEHQPAQAEREELAANDASILENQDTAMQILEEIRDAVVPGGEAGRTAATRPRR